MPVAAVMSFMSVPALDRLLEPSEIESSSVQPWSTRAERRSAINMSPLFPSQPHTQPSPPQARISPPPFSPSPYVLNFKRRVFESANDVSADAASYVSTQTASGQFREATSSIRGESEVAGSNSKTVPNEAGVLSVREVQDRLRFGGNSFDRHERSRVKSIDKVEKLMSNPGTKSVGDKDNGQRQQESGWELRSRNGSNGKQDYDSLSISSSNREEFFDAPEEPFDDSTSDEESVRAQRTPRSKSGGRRDVDGNLKSLLDQEIKRRMAAEDAMAVLQLQCTEMASNLASGDEESRDLNDTGGNDCDSDSQRLVVAKVVAYSVARGAARAEVDVEMENVVVEKNREIARLRDKLHYYELVNQEMSQRNQEAFELARTRRHVRRNRNQWLMVCAGSVLCMGVSAILVRKFVPWSSPARGILPSCIRTDAYHSALSHDV